MTEMIGHYEIIEELGRGGMGVVYKAHEASLNRSVAVKVLGEHLAKDEEFVRRFQREAQAAAALNHPNIVQVYAFGEDKGRYYFAMEFVNGISVQETIKREGRLAPDRAAGIILQAARGLDAAHKQGMIHRDIKPANLMINKQGLVKIADFGLALRPSDQTRLTASGMVMGTPGYLSPEQYLGKEVDERTDIYALGVSLFEMLTGRVPFNADSPAALMREIVDGTPQDMALLAPDIPESLQRIVKKMMAKDPNERYQHADEIVTDVTGFLQARGSDAVNVAPLPLSHPAGANGGQTTPVPRPPAPPPLPESPKRTPLLLLFALLFLGVVLLGAGGIVLHKSGFFGKVKSLISHSTPAEKVPAEGAEFPAETAAPQEAATGEAVNLGAPLEALPPGAKKSTSKAPAAPPRPAEGSRTAPPPPSPARATATSRPAPPPPPPPGTVVVALGDALIGDSIEKVLSGSLASSGITVRDGFEIPAVQSAVADARNGSVDVGALVKGLARTCSHVVVARINVVSQRQLNYYGRSDTAWTADVVVNAYDTASGRALGPPCRKRIEYTTIGVEAKVEYELKECAANLPDIVR